MYAIIRTGGKQYRVAVGDVVDVDLLGGEAGSEVTFDEVLMLGGDGTARVGQPLVEKAAVKAELLAHVRGEKIVVFKMKRRKNYKRTTGHRQELTRVRITDIAG